MSDQIDAMAREIESLRDQRADLLAALKDAFHVAAPHMVVPEQVRIAQIIAKAEGR